MESTNCISDNLKSMINNKMLSDIVLEFGYEQKRLYAHKLILSVRSNVFNKMFTGPLVTDNQSIQIKECSSDEFLQILNYCYTDKVQLKRDNVCGIIAAANYYEMINLEEQCCDFVIEYLDVTNVCTIYEAMSLLSNKLTAKCLRMIDDNMTQIIHQDDFSALSKSTLESVLARDQLSISEFELYVAVEKWITQNNESWNKLWQLIRFPIMTDSEFHQCCQTHGIMFNSQTMEDTKRFIETGHPTPELPFSTIKREVYVEKEYEFLFDGGFLFHWNDGYEVNNMGLTVRHKTKITRFEFVRYENHLLDSIIFGIELSYEDDDSILFEKESSKSFIDCDDYITLMPNVTYTLASMVSWKSEHRNSHKLNCNCDDHYCTFDMSQVSFMDNDGKKDDDGVEVTYIGDGSTFISKITFRILK